MQPFILENENYWPDFMSLRLWQMLIFVLVNLGSCCLASEVPKIDFAHDVVPILRNHCVECHGGKQAEGGLSFNTRDQLLQSAMVEVGASDESEMISRIQSDDQELLMPPPDHPPLSSEQKLILMNWIDEGLSWATGFRFDADGYQPPLKLKKVTIETAEQDGVNPIDALLRLQKQVVTSSTSEITDSQFYRRVSLDLVGLLPSVTASRAFIAEKNPSKRELLIDQLLTQSIDYADHWMSFFNDLFRNDYSGTGFITGGRKQISGWLYASLLNNKPYDVMARDLIAPASKATSGFIDGIRWRGEVSAGQTVELQFAQSLAQAFLGINLKCASCHDSFIDRWKLEDAYGLAAIYANRQLDLYRCDQPLGKFAKPSWLFPELGQVDAKANREERLRQLADLVTDPNNASFSRAIVNRLWCKLMGRGIVHPIDAMHDQPWNDELLDFLSQYLIDQDYDLKALLRLIVTSNAYQSMSTQNVEEKGERYHFDGPMVRRLTAEQFLDAVWQITGAGPSKYDAPVARDNQEEVREEYRQLEADWIWGASASNGLIPPAGEKLAFRKEFGLESICESAGMVITCDNAFEIYLNGSHLGGGKNWEEPSGIQFQGLLKKGSNELIVIARNAGNSPNPAGLYLEALFVLADSTTKKINSDTTWTVTEQIPKIVKGEAVTDSGQWYPAVSVEALSVWSEAIQGKGPQVLQAAVLDQTRMTRASLMKNNPLMKALGRPMREQIVSMRPNDLTALEAMNLSNGPAFSKMLHEGARLLLKESSKTSELVTNLYEYAYTRKPNADELRIAEDYLGQSPEEGQLADLLWSIFMSPEFLLIR